MKIGIISDTHNNLEYTKKAIAYFNAQKVEKVFHAGDMVSAEFAEVFEDLEMPMILAFGNCDHDRFSLKKYAEVCADICRVELAGKKIVMAHKFCFDQESDVIIHGHTHIVENQKIGNIRILNPGECSARKFGKSTVMIYDFNKDEVIVKEL